MWQAVAVAAAATLCTVALLGAAVSPAQAAEPSRSGTAPIGGRPNPSRNVHPVKAVLPAVERGSPARAPRPPAEPAPDDRVRDYWRHHGVG